MNELSQDLLRELFDYRDGELYWKVRKAYQIKIGDRAGTPGEDGYRRIIIDGKQYLTHRLIFLWHHGYLPKELDHIDGNPADNKISNLRKSTHQENIMNQKKTKIINGKPTSSRFKGVYLHKPTKKWVAYIWIDDKQKNLGYFTFEIEAALTYNKAAIKWFGEFARLNEV